MGGGIVRVRQRWPEKNHEECPICHEPRRFPCRDTATRKLLYTTHTTASKQRQARRK
jgi:hypothetical protein